MTPLECIIDRGLCLYTYTYTYVYVLCYTFEATDILSHMTIKVYKNHLAVSPCVSLTCLGTRHQNIMDTWRVPYASPCLTWINQSLGASVLHRLFLTPLHRSQYWSIPRTYLSAKLVPKSKLSFVKIVKTKFAGEWGKRVFVLPMNPSSSMEYEADLGSLLQPNQ